ncbi:response regulator [Herbidospora mongoliensis]|uniref:response regulator n=1 Tax=Herbidospora mongoliensis TaxID=688067 RepID=UPI000833265E|nr:response regulator transcription factor [Herbidospora mongoliensis]
MIRVLIADDHPLVREGLGLIVESTGDMTVVGAAADGAQAVRLARETEPDVVVMDLHMPHVDGLAATAELAVSPVKVLILSNFDLDEQVVDALRAGAAGFLPKDVSPEDVIAAIRVVHRGEATVAPRLLTRLIGSFVRAAKVRPARLAELTPKEREILTYIAHGHSNSEIATDLELSPSTVKNHITSVFAKIGARDRAQAVVVAYESGLVRAMGAGS